jgi:hypothetical protein
MYISILADSSIGSGILLLLLLLLLLLYSREKLLVFHRAPPLVADGAMLTRYGGYRGNKILWADQNQHCCLAV